MSSRSFRGVRVVRFGEFEFDLRAGELRQGERKARLQDQPRRILAMLVEHPGEVVLREEICKRLWPNGTVVEVSHGINAAVLRLRDALGDSAENPRFVETVARRGYRFLAPVEVDCRPASPGRHESPGAGFDTEALAGQTLSHFRLEEMLGRGGMGVVYRAEDLSLGRMVALKFLAAEMAADPAAVSRFQREARLASALNHPNICTVHAVEECAGQPVIVMELLEGRTLESMLAAGPMPVETALPLALQMAAALDAAHRKRIVHRDLKPGNVMVTESCLKVLDFGLAKQSVTGLSRPSWEVTQAASVLGTPTYMAPEQFQGKEADPRSDIYALGLVLREMLTGCRAADDPRRSLPAAAADLDPIVRRCVETNPEERWQTARDLKAALELVAAARAARPPAAVAEPARTGAPGWPRWAVSGVAAAVLILAGLAAWKGLRPDAPAPRLVRFEAAPAVFQPSPPMPQKVPPSETAPPAATMARFVSIADSGPMAGARMNLSPDGRFLAYGSAGQVYVRALDSGETRLISSGAGMAGVPFWAPDGQSLAFTRGGKLFTASLKGGVAKPIADINTNLAGAWGPDGTILIGAIGDGLVAIPASGGPARKVTTPDPSRGETRHLLPQFLPGGRKFLYTAGSNQVDKGRLYVGSLDAAVRAEILPIDSGATFVPRSGVKGYLVFERGGYLMAQGFDTAALRTEGDAFPIAGPVTGSRAAAAMATRVADFSATPATLVYRSPGGRGGRLLPVVLTGDKKEAEATQMAGLVVVKDWMARLEHQAPR